MLNIAYGLGGRPTPQSPAAPSPMLNLMPIILIFVIFYFLLIRPQRAKQREHERMVSGLKKNDEVITNGGIHGTVVGVKDNSVILRVDDNVRIEVQKSAITHLKKQREEKT